MGAYNRTNGEACCGSRTLIGDILRGKWGFEGHFVSDCWAIRDFHEKHKVTNTAAESAALAINEGCDLNCGSTYAHLLDAYDQGLVSEETITEAAIRLYTTRYMLGLFDEDAYKDIPYNVVECKEHLALSEKVAQESFVLLKNNGVLPLDKKKLNSIAVVGPNANSREALIGNYHGSASDYVTVQEGLLRYLDGDVRVYTSVGCHLFKDNTESLGRRQDRVTEAKIVIKNSDAVICCVGLDETLEGEEGDTGNSYASGDKESLYLPTTQCELMEAVAQAAQEADIPAILCIMAGSDIDVSAVADDFDAIIVLWYPGSRGGMAAAKTLFGEVSPSGKLPVTFYNSLEELPEFTDYNMAGRTYRYMEGPAQYPFGYGLTYGDCKVCKASVDKAEDGSYVVEALVCNEGAMDTKDVLQVYVKKEDSSLDSLHPSLCGFKKVFVPAGKEEKVSIVLPAQAFTVVDEDGNRVSAGENYRFYVGFSQPDERSEELTGQKSVEISLSF